MEWQVSEFDRQADQIWGSASERPPRSVAAAVLALTHGQEANYSYIDKYLWVGLTATGQRHETTTWPIIVLTHDRMVCVTAFKAEADWTGGSPSAKTEPADSLDAWSRPLSAVWGVDVASSSLERLTAELVEVSFVWRLRVEGEEDVTLPLGGVERRHAPDAEPLVAAIFSAIES